MRLAVDRVSRRLPAARTIGIYGAEIAKRLDIVATAIFNEMTVDAIEGLDLSYTPLLGSPWDAVQTAAQHLAGCLPSS